MKEMVGGCCVCSDERGWPENPLVYCDGQNCTVAVHQACYGIVTVPTGPWYCRKCESQERSTRVRCELCPSRDGALKKTDNQGWAHVVCALYIPEVRFGNVSTMEPIILQLIPPERYNKPCYICAEMGKGSKSTAGACMQCNKSGCKQQFHVTCAQQLGLLCEEAGNYLDNVKYCGYCQHHYSKLKKGGNVKPIPPYKPISRDDTNSSDSPSSPEKESEASHTPSRSNRAIDPLATSSTSSKQKKSSSNNKSSSTSNANLQNPYTSNSGNANNATSNVITTSGSSSRNSSSSSKEKDKEGKHSSSNSSKSVNKISSSTNNKEPYTSYSTGSSRDKNKSSSSSSTSSKNSQNASNNKDDNVTSNSHNSKNSSSQFSSSATIRITTSSATPTSPVSTIIHKHDVSTSKDNVVQSSINSVVTPHVQNSTSKVNGDEDEEKRGRASSWQTQNNIQSSGMKLSSANTSASNSMDGLNDNNSDVNKAAMTKKRKALHQTNSSSNRSSADENVNKDICKDLSVKVDKLPIDKSDPSVSEYERHFKKARTDLNPLSTTPATASQTPTLEPNIQNVNPNVIHSVCSAVTSASINFTSSVSPPQASIASDGTSNNNKSQVITQNIHAKSSGSGTKDDRQQTQHSESLVVSVPLSSATVPGIQLPTTNSSSNNNSTISTIVATNQIQQQAATSSPTMPVSSSAPAHGSLYQHLTNNQQGPHRTSPLIQQQQAMGRSSPSTATPSPHNHTSVLQNMNALTGGVISSAGFHNVTTTSNSTTETSPSGMLKVTYEKQTGSRLQAIQQEEARRSRSQSNDNKKGKKRTTTDQPSSGTNHSHHARTHKTNKSNAKLNVINEKRNDGDSSLSIGSGPSTNAHQSSTSNGNQISGAITLTTTTSSLTQSTVVKLSQASSSGSARTSSPNITILKKYRDEPSSSRTPDVPFGAHSASTTTTSGGLKFGYELQQQPAGLVINTSVAHQPIKDSPPSSPGSEASARKRRKGTNSLTPQPSPHNLHPEQKEKDTKTVVLLNGAIPSTHHMLGNQLNPSSNMAKNMTDTLNMEIEAHSIYSHEPSSNLIGPHYPGRKDSNKPSSSSSSTTTSSGPASLTSLLSGASSSSNGAPQSLEQLLERQWEQGSQFLMEQAQHFDIASLLSCLHQLKIENSRLEDHINGLVSRRDHLLAVNARLAIPLSQPPSAGQATHLNNGPSEPTTVQQPPAASITNKRTVPSSNPVSTIQVPLIENGLDYRGHHASSSNQMQSTASSQNSNIRRSPVIPSKVLNVETTSNQSAQQQQHHPYSSNVQFQQQMYQQQPTHVNSVRIRQGNSYQSQQQQQQQSGYPPPHKTKN